MIRSKIYLFSILIFIGLISISYAQQGVSQREKSQKDIYRKEVSRLKELSIGADVIVSGKVSQKKSGWNENKTRIFTRTAIRVDEYIKGQNTGDVVEIITPGGEVNGVGELYTHMPSFEDDEDVVVFLKKDKRKQEYKVFNGEEGKISVLRDEKTNKKATRSKINLETIKSQVKNILSEHK